jgi:hypothetical protein
LVLDPAAVIHWQVRETSRGLLAQYRRYGRGKASVVRRWPRSTRPRHVAPAAAAVGAAVGFATRPRLTVLGAAGMGLAYASAGMSLRWESGAPMRAATSLACMHAGFALGFIEGMVPFTGSLPSQATGVDASSAHHRHG